MKQVSEGGRRGLLGIMARRGERGERRGNEEERTDDELREQRTERKERKSEGRARKERGLNPKGSHMSVFHAASRLCSRASAPSLIPFILWHLSPEK